MTGAAATLEEDLPARLGSLDIVVLLPVVAFPSRLVQLRFGSLHPLPISCAILLLSLPVSID